MGRAPCCSEEGLQRGPWTAMEDTLLIDYIRAHGEGNWRSLPKKAGLLRCGKSCRLRWMNYLRPDIKRGNITRDEDDLIIRLHSLLGNRWSLIARMLPGRTDNEIKNYWNSHLKKGVKQMGKTLEKPSKINSKNGEIYRPKPYKVTSSIISGPTSGTSNAREDEGSKPSVEAPGLPWLQADNEGGSEGDAGGVLVHNQHDDESELYSQYDQMPTNDNKFEKLYQEYLELLMADDSTVAAVES